VLEGYLTTNERSLFTHADDQVKRCRLSDGEPRNFLAVHMTKPAIPSTLHSTPPL
jgi:hypothetical protein